MGDSNQRLTETFVDEEPHALLSRALKGKDLRPVAFFPLPAPAAGVPAPWKRAHVQRCYGDLLFIQGWIAFKNLLRCRALRQHVSHEVDGNPRALEDGCSTHNAGIAHHEIFDVGKLLH